VSMPRVDLSGRLGDTRDRLAGEQIGQHAPLEPMFSRLTRKEARVREDQYAALSALTRTLMRRRKVKAERITENTLIRVAIDLLLAEQSRLRGSTEDELRKSVTSELRIYETPDYPTSDGSEHPESRTPPVPPFQGSSVRESQAVDLRHFHSSSVPSPDASGLRSLDERHRS
jgi:hypothetical protein